MKERALNALITVGSIVQVADIQAPVHRYAKCSSHLICCTVRLLLYLCSARRMEMGYCSNEGLILHLTSPSLRSHENFKGHNPDVKQAVRVANLHVLLHLEICSLITQCI